MKGTEQIMRGGKKRIELSTINCAVIPSHVTNKISCLEGLVASAPSKFDI
jgi:hypothetical protein